ncbi:hypothetical protein [Vitiosangium sp. GDMCC 1.1324]|uniref:hypothetical protein n=1 Tax=Vitiosangium sp. (strain GDMCC 1.1324) TaxID=2138576 RepID=UPI0011B36AF7|nr:hypothetical protein [Vitiosangium sp. GDMCC 1.1324]
MIALRKLLGAAALVSAAGALVPGCGGWDPMGGVDAGPKPGCTGVCSADGGAVGDAGTWSDAGTQADGGTLPAPVVMAIAEARKSPFDGQTRVLLEGVVIHTLADVAHRVQNGEEQVRAHFWVVDPARPMQGLWVHKDWTDLPVDFLPEVGQRVDLTGWMQAASGLEPFTGYRTHLGSQRAFGGQSGTLEIHPIGTLAVPADNTVAAGFGNADGGFGRPNPGLLGTRVYVPGPLQLTDPTPRAFHRESADPKDPVYYGFEVSGGILVSSQNTSGASPTDGGPARCDWQALVRGDGGSVVFPQGIRGVWDTYTFVPCRDGGIGECTGGASDGGVPGTEPADGGPGNRFTHVLYPQNCDRDLAGVWDAGIQGSGG